VRLNRKSSYGLIAALDLATRGAETPISARSIASKYGLPVSFVEKILHELAGAGLVEGQKGRGGGYRLAVDPAAISIRRVIEALGESVDLVGCLGREPDCRLESVCPTKPTWERADRRFKALLDSLSLSDFLAP
jgi:Rrf2 family iron-sulfur cluster assembly transcriptional regulator